MEDDARMVEAARRKARRMARKTELTYQQSLDAVARSLGRDHWAAFTASPVEVPRDDAPATALPDERILDRIVALAVASRTEIVIDGPDDVHVIDAAEYELLVSMVRDRARMRTAVGMEVGTWQQESGGIPVHISVTVMEDRLSVMAMRTTPHDVLSADMVPTDPAARLEYLQEVADTLIGANPRPSWFDLQARLALRAFIETEVMIALRERRPASITSMISWINDGFDGSGRTERGIVAWLEGLTAGVGISGLEDAERDIRLLSELPHRGRSDVLGIVDRALMPFAAKAPNEV